MTVREYQIQNLDCAGCSAKIESEISNLAEVNSVNLDFINKKLVIQYKDDAANALDILNKIASGIEPGVKIYDSGHDIEEKKSFYSFVIYGGLLLLLITYFLPENLAFRPLLYWLSYLMVSGRVLYSAVREIFSRQLLAEHFLMGIASLGAMYLGEFTEAVAVIALYELGQYLEHKAVSKSRNTVSSIMNLKPEKAHLKTDSGLKEIKLNQVKPGDILVVHPGERIPVDGLIMKGETSLDTSSVSGESAPLAVATGDEIYAGCLNHEGLIEMKALRGENESMVAKILALIDNAASRKSRQERFITRFASIYTPVVVALAVLVFLIPLIMGVDAQIMLKRSLVFLIVSCPCALVISIPLTYYIGIGIAAKRGIIFKGSTFLDGLRQVKTVVFDKTGTLTTGNLRLEKLYTSENISEDELSRALYESEFGSRHPFAIAVKNAMEYDFELSKRTEYNELPGKGIVMVYDGKEYLAGSFDFIRERGFENLFDTAEYSAVHVVKDGLYLGAAAFGDDIKPGMQQSLAHMRKLGVENMYLLSGDRDRKAASVANTLGLDGYKAELLPQDKLVALEEIMHDHSGLTAYTGDGMNDAPVLARADIGIAMGGIGAQASIDSADIVLMNDKAEQLALAFELSRKTNSKIWQNISLALGIKILVMILGVSGVSGLWEAIIADVGVTLLVIFNSLQLNRFESKLDKY
ncbi:MAG: cadmium-translocating P-type ATPase [Candidatus Cloacimonetes bacterium]|jgi:Cd2+/Zn2+-exporting ATPase|nr:cadmium-translocating P-type ATPase [Candidatus Cloacimonadota bacterium]